MKWVIAILSALALVKAELPAVAQSRGGDSHGASRSNGSRGGGGAYFCTDAGGSGQTKYFSVDYAMFSQHKATLDLNYNFSGDCERSLREISTMLARRDPVLAAGLDQVRESFFQGKTDFPGGIQRVWEPACAPGQRHCLRDLKDDKTGAVNPVRCKKIQLAERIQEGARIVTRYDRDAVAEMSRTDPVQCTHFLVHEWLRDILPSASEIRGLTATMHYDHYYRDKFLEISDPPSKMFGDMFPLNQTPFSSSSQVSKDRRTAHATYASIILSLDKSALEIIEESDGRKEVFYYANTTRAALEGRKVEKQTNPNIYLVRHLFDPRNRDGLFWIFYNK